MKVISHFTLFMCKYIKIYLLLSNLRFHLLLSNKIILIPSKFQICRTMLSYIAKSNVNNIVAWYLMNPKKNIQSKMFMAGVG